MNSIAVFCFFMIVLCAGSTIASAAEVILEDGSAINIRTGDTKQLHQNYSLTVKYVNLDDKRVWISLQRNGESVKDDILGERETLEYSRDNSTILNVTLKQIYYGSEGELVTFEPVFQYFDPELSLSSGTGDNTTNPNEEQEISTNPDSSNTIPGFGIAGTFLCLAGIYLLRSRIKA